MHLMTVLMKESICAKQFTNWEGNSLVNIYHCLFIPTYVIKGKNNTTCKLIGGFIMEPLNLEIFSKEQMYSAPTRRFHRE